MRYYRSKVSITAALTYQCHRTNGMWIIWIRWHLKSKFRIPKPLLCYNQSYSDFHQFDKLPNALHANTSTQLKLCAYRYSLVDWEFILIRHGRLADGLIFDVMTSESGKVTVDRCYWRCLFVQSHFIFEPAWCLLHYSRYASSMWTMFLETKRNECSILQPYILFKWHLQASSKSGGFVLNDGWLRWLTHDDQLLIRLHNDARKLWKPHSNMHETLWKKV